MRRTKIVATIGPASREPEVLVRMVQAGMDVARLNYSHGSPEQLADTVRRVRDAAGRAGRPVAILQDLPGPKLRIGALSEGLAELKVGDVVTFAGDEATQGDAQRMSVSWRGMASALGVGAVLYLADGSIRLAPGLDQPAADPGAVMVAAGAFAPVGRLTSRVMTRRRDIGLGAALGLVLALVLGGCSIGSNKQAGDTLSAATSHGLSYTVRVDVVGNQHCVTASYRTALRDGRPVTQGSHVCGPPALPGHPMLIQAQTSRESLLVDVTASGCGMVRAGATRATVRAVSVHCTTGQPRYRVSTLPQARRLLIVGVPGAPVVNFPRHRCLMSLCITPLA